MKVGILYNYVDHSERGLDQDKISDNEILTTVKLVQEALGPEHVAIPVRASVDFLHNLEEDSFDLIFNLCEGFLGKVNGEAYMAGYLELIGMPYTGSDPSTLSLCLDKGRVKDILRINGIPTPKSQVFDSLCTPLDGTLRYPLIVKPLQEDASVGIDQSSVVTDEFRLMARVEYILRTYKQPALVEEYIDGRELNVAIIGNLPHVEVLPISEIVFNLEEGDYRIVDYGAKWLESTPQFQGTKGVCPAELDRETEELVKNLALESCRLLGCRDYARVDFRLGEDGPTVLEVNPNPGLNDDSGFVRSALAKGLSYRDMIRFILDNAVSRAALTPKQVQIPREHFTDKILAREVRLDDIPRLVKWFNDPILAKFMSDPSKIYTEESLIESFFVKVHNDTDLLIEDKATRKPLGFLSIYDIDDVNHSAEISFLIGENEFRGVGLGKEVSRLVADICFEELNLNRVIASVTVENYPTIKVLEDVGFKKAGLLREYQVVEGRKLDERIMEILREDYHRMKVQK